MEASSSSKSRATRPKKSQTRWKLGVLRPSHPDPPTDRDYSRVYGMRADTESLNAQFERAFYN